MVIATLIIVERFSDYLSWRFPKFRRTTESVPVILVEDGKTVEHAMRKSHLSEDDIVTAGRTMHGLERMDQIKWAVLESSGGISVVPKENAAPLA